MEYETVIKAIQNIQVIGVNRQTVRRFYDSIKKTKNTMQFIFKVNFKDYPLLLKTLKKAYKKKHIISCETRYFIAECEITITLGDR